MASSFARSSVGPPPSSPLFPSSCLPLCVPLSDPLQIHYFLRHRQPHRMRRPTTQVHSPPLLVVYSFFPFLSPPSGGALRQIVATGAAFLLPPPPLGRHHCCIGAPTQKEKKKTKTRRRPFPSIHYACWLPFGLLSLPWAFSSNVREREKVLLINATGKREEEEGGRRTKQSNGDGGGTGWSFPPLAKLGR